MSTSLKLSLRHVFALGLVLAFLCLLPAILPYGGRYVTRGDYIEQQLPFIVEAQHLLRNGSAYSFSTFLGAPAIGSYAFYTLGSPFVWPLTLLPKAAIPYGISVMALLKHALCMLFSFLYLRRMTSERPALLGSILYTFSSFTVVNTQFYHFTEVICFFPLILLGMEMAMSRTPRPGFLVFACFINTLTNYYFMFASALLSGLYFLCRLFSPDWKDTRSPLRVLLVLFECALGCGLCAFLLLPVLYSTLQLTRTGAGAQIPLSYALPDVLERIRVLLMPIESNVVHAYYGDAASWTSTACHLPVLGLAATLCFLRRPGQDRWLRVLFLLLLLFSFIPVLCGLFSLESNLHYTRWWYGLALVQVLCSVRQLPDSLSPSQKDLVRLRTSAFICLFLTLFLTLPFLLPQALLSALPGPLSRIGQILLNRRQGAYAPGVFRAFSLLLTALGFAVLFFLLYSRPKARAVFALISLCVCLQYTLYISVGDSTLRSGGEMPGSGKYTLSDIAGPSLSALQCDAPDTFRRIDYGQRLRNYGLLRGMSSLTAFQSLRTQVIGRFIALAGFGYDESTTVSAPNASGALRAFLSVSEYHRTDEDDPIPEGFVYDREENGFPVYVNPNALPMGFLQTCLTGNYDQPMNPDSIGRTLLAAAALEKEDFARYRDRMDLLDPYAIPDWKESVQRLKAQSCHSFTLHPNGFDAEIDAPGSGMVVFTIPWDPGFSATLDGQSVPIERCDISFMGVFVEAGSHSLQFRYTQPYLLEGVAVSALLLFVLGVYLRFARRLYAQL